MLPSASRGPEPQVLIFPGSLQASMRIQALETFIFETPDDGSPVRKRQFDGGAFVKRTLAIANAERRAAI